HYEADVDWWDDHYTIEKNLRRRLPPFDRALASLIEDLHQRGLDRRGVGGGGGAVGGAAHVGQVGRRGPRPRAGGGPPPRAGRGAMSVLLSGGGVRGGQVVGATSANGGEPRERPLGPGDLLATVYHVLGLDPAATARDRQDRPVRLVETGEPIRELF